MSELGGGGGNGSQITHIVCFICNPQDQEFEDGMLSFGLLSLFHTSHLTTGPGHIPLD
jgi:hypothetical protein